MPPALPTGLLILHGDRLELLAQAVCEWLGRHPLAPLETETLLVQSNGMGEWLKMALASRHGICAATSVELPARFLWRAYRAVLGAAAVPSASALDKGPLTWRLMALLPTLSREPGYEPLRAFLGADDADAGRRLQLAQRLADLYDQYQVHRSDWLDDWAQGQDVLRRTPERTGTEPMPPAQRWQAALWRALRQTLDEDALAASRPALHRRFVQALRPADAGHDGNGTTRLFPGLPRRVVLFGTTHVPLQTLEAIAALAGHCQVLMAVPNPCRHHWADTLDGRELLRLQHRRHAPRKGVDLAEVPLEQMHAHGHPLLSAWGRQSRDFVRQLDAFDDAEAARQRFALPRLDLFDETPPRTLLEQVQAAVRDLTPLAEHPRQPADPTDRSIVFHVAHSAQREVEILHDQLLHLLAHPPADRPLAPRDIVVMVPDIDLYAPAVRSVFGQHPTDDPRHIPWGLADQKDRGRHPVLRALDWLLRAPQQRFGASEVLDLLDVPAVAARLELDPQDLSLLARWIDGAGVRWGLDAAHRASLGLGEAGEQNTWAFGLRRMLLGYATGEADGAAMPTSGEDTHGADLSHAAVYGDLAPYAEVAGLEAGLAGTLAHALQGLSSWWVDARASRTPSQWAERLRQLIALWFQPTDTADRALMAALDAALAQWLQACEAGGFDEPVDLAVAREAWLGAVDEPGLTQRFRAGGVTFCTLLPLRAIPFEVVCLLGMNDGDYPRRASRGDFDLMAQHGLARPGDRSRRDDDRQLMLDAMLSARQVLYVSWTGHSQRDNSEQPPSVLVAQLRDYLRDGWDAGTVDRRTTVHPLQPFSRRYFEPDGLPTYAAEWRAAHGTSAASEASAASAASATADAASGQGSVARAAGVDTAAIVSTVEARPALASAPASMSGPPQTQAPQPPLTVQALADFLRNPVKAYFRHRLRVSFDDLDPPVADDEPFGSPGLERWALIDEVLDGCRRRWGASATPVDDAETAAVLAQQLDGLQRAGRLPLAGPGRHARESLQQALEPMLGQWLHAHASHPQPLDRLRLHLTHPQRPDLVLDDVLDGVRAPAEADAATPCPAVWIEWTASRIAQPAGKSRVVPRPDKFAAAWVRCLATAACGQPVEGVLIGDGAWVQVRCPPRDEAMQTLVGLLQAWQEGMTGDRPLPTALRTGLAWLAGGEDPARKAYEGDDSGKSPGEVEEPSLARLFPDFDRLGQAEGFAAASLRLYAPYRQWLDECTTVQAWEAHDDGEGDSDDD